MTGLSSLWLPILLSAVAVFVASSILHMVLPWHRGDYPRLPDEDAFRSAVRPLAIPPGDYMVPRAAGPDELKDPAFQAKVNEGPVLVMTVMPNQTFNMARNLGLWFVYCLVVSLFAAYVAGRARGPGADYLDAFRFASVTAFIGYSLALWQMSIWFQRAWSLTIKSTIDGLVYGLITGGFFGWLWPS